MAEVLLRKAERLKATPNQPLKLLISGAPGIGKTSLVNLIARTLVSHPAAIEDVNGREVGLDVAREWTRSLAYASMFGPWSIKVVNELDRCSKDAQDMLVTYLDRLRPGHAFPGTTYLHVVAARLWPSHFPQRAKCSCLVPVLHFEHFSFQLLPKRDQGQC